MNLPDDELDAVIWRALAAVEGQRDSHLLIRREGTHGPPLYVGDVRALAMAARSRLNRD